MTCRCKYQFCYVCGLPGRQPTTATTMRTAICRQCPTPGLVPRGLPKNDVPVAETAATVQWAAAKLTAMMAATATALATAIVNAIATVIAWTTAAWEECSSCC